MHDISQNRDLDWFPRLRAKSLAADEGEGEQVELRSLQSQLESTQQLVKCLSQQLTELRDQVSVNNCAMNLCDCNFYFEFLSCH